jgi:peptide/nickel transport system permease protein
VASILAGTPTKVAPAEPEARLYVASQWQLMWWRFSKHRVALASGIVVLLIYLVALFPEVLAVSYTI